MTVTKIANPSGGDGGSIERGWWAFLTLSVNQSSDVGLNDPIQFDTKQYSGFPSDFLDITTNIGRFTLPAGRTFKLTSYLYAELTSATTLASMGFLNVTAGTAIGIVSRCFAPASTSWNQASTFSSVAIITPTVETEVILRLANANVSIVYIDSACLIEEIRGED